MMGLEPWWLDLWVFVGTVMSGLAACFALVGFIMVAVEGRKAWTRELTLAILSLILLGWLFPFVVVAFVLVGIWRIVSGK